MGKLYITMVMVLINGPRQLISFKIKIPLTLVAGVICTLWQLENFKDEKPHKKNTFNSNLGIIGATETKGLTAALELQKQVALSLSNWSSTESYSF